MYKRILNYLLRKIIKIAYDKKVPLDFSRLSIHDADFSRCHMERLDFTRSNLYRINYHGASFDACNFSYTILYDNCNLYNTNVMCDLTKISMPSAIFDSLCLAKGITKESRLKRKTQELIEELRRRDEKSKIS